MAKYGVQPLARELVNVLELVIITWIGFFLMKFMFDFAVGMEALSEIDKAIRGY